ncbi:metallophosphoesterase [Halalkalibacter sp. APA_J-10(15)]|uniref:metallophosphoesterase family protein n=1 Tax=Halalkalibacter sp. APA_J-10(15) TaxID=2933805 RepID=UPI001FF4101E|nr:metallophosphoesterase [Halalkalibacter sp. APA_J-10(15)]MCK0470381.1 metallophosphoesterase [Halalkalibacter sp. APA_J-10(15)]
MKSNKIKSSLIVAKKLSPFIATKTEDELSSELVARFELYPENTRRPVNKILFRNDYFQLTYSMKKKDLVISSRGDIVYSAIPYDTARNYIQRATIQYLLHPEEVREYIKMHKGNLEKYIMLSIFQVTKKRVDKNSFEVKQAYNAIFQNPLFEIQILGRLLQHDETGPISANLAGKFLFSENVNTGISEYIFEYLNFVVQLTKSLPITTDGKSVKLLETNLLKRSLANNRNKDKFVTYKSDIKPALSLLPLAEKVNTENPIIIAKQTLNLNDKPILRSRSGKEISEVRKNYIPHSVHPKESEKYFENVLSTENTNLLNVVSDVHTIDGEIPFINSNFNILVGDISDSRATNGDIKGIYVIGNHELVDVLPDNNNIDELQGKKWSPFLNSKWFKQLLEKPDESWHMLPVGNHRFYEVVKVELEKRFPQLNVLHNNHIVHEGIRYIGLTIPVALVKRKNEQQKFILKSLKELLNNDYDIPTIIVSHAPLFNELSMLSIKSKAYNKDYNLSEPKIEKLFKEYNIIGAIHGHHHIPASSGQSKIVKFASKELFVVCSIYSKMNTGFELMNLINPKLTN